jgi:lipoprotein-releasing system permease protein
MPLEWALCLRYMRAARSSGSVSFVTGVAGLGVALGVAALVVAMAVMNGYQANLLQVMAGALPHVSLLPATEHAFADPESLKAVVADAVHPRTIARYGSLDTLLRRADAPGAPMQALALRGIEPAIEAQETGFLAYLDDGSAGWKARPLAERLRVAGDLLRSLDPATASASAASAPHATQHTARPPAEVGVFLSHVVATRLGVHVGDAVSLLEFPKGGGFTPLPRGPKLVVRGLFDTGILAFDEAIALTGFDALLAIGPRSEIETSLGLRLERPLAASEIADRLRDLPAPAGDEFHVFSWLESNKSLFQVILLQKVMLYLVLMLIVLIASFGMISALIMLVTEKTREITILKALGAPERTVRRVFLLQGVLIGVGGMVVGLALGFAICWVLATFPLFEIPPGVYPGSDRIPVRLAATDVLWVVLGTLAIAVGATQFPALKAMRVKIVEGLRRG